jgi:hypothetical protein
LNRLSPNGGPDPVIPWGIQIGDQELSLFATMSTFGTPHDITVSELTIELFFPDDQATETFLRRLPHERTVLTVTTIGVAPSVASPSGVHSHPKITLECP